jgi:hypothetical protein
MEHQSNEAAWRTCRSFDTNTCVMLATAYAQCHINCHIMSARCQQNLRMSQPHDAPAGRWTRKRV